MRKELIYTQTVAANTWEIQLPDSFVKGSVAVEVVRDETGESLTPDNDRVVDDLLILHFGLDEHMGTARYSWIEDDSQSVVTDEYGNNVSITITQNGGTTPSGSTF